MHYISNHSFLITFFSLASHHPFFFGVLNRKTRGHIEKQNPGESVFPKSYTVPVGRVGTTNLEDASLPHPRFRPNHPRNGGGWFFVREIWDEIPVLKFPGKIYRMVKVNFLFIVRPGPGSEAL